MEKQWNVVLPEPSLQEGLSRELNISQIVAQVLINRGFNDVETAREFLTEIELHDPSLMKDMKKAVTRIKKAIKNGELIAVAGDYDVDGVTSVAILVEALTSLGAKGVTYYMPDRVKDGYGLNVEAVDRLAAEGATLIITSDNGISCIDAVDKANALGVDVVITDHHDVPKKLPKAHAIVTPKQPKCNYPFKDLCGAGVALKLVQALKCDVTPYLDLVCLATVADVVPLVGENRQLVKMGLPFVGNRPGIKALLDVAGIKGVPTSGNIAFNVAPKINAAGRLAHADIALQLLMAKDAETTTKLAQELNDLNNLRRKVEGDIQDQAVKQIEEHGLDKDKVIIVAGEGWNHGVVGNVASKLVERYYRPVIVLAIDEAVAKGSARSIPGFHLFDSLTEASGLLEKYGGHEMAAGLTVKVENIEPLRAKLNELAERVLTDEDMVPGVDVDALLSLTEVTEELLEQFKKLEPFGQGNREPVLMCGRISVMDSRVLGEGGKHLKLKVSNGAVFMDSIGFSKAELANIAGKGAKIDVVFHLDQNEWQGKTNLQLRLIDIKQAVCEAGELSFIESLYDQAAELLVSDWYRNIGDKDEFYTKAVGVIFEGRQEVIRDVSDGEIVSLVREPENQFDPNAVRIERRNGQQIGFLKADLSKYLAPIIDSGVSYDCVVTMITGKGDGEKNLGANLSITRVVEGEDVEVAAEMSNCRKALRYLNEGALKATIRQALLGDYDYRGKQMEAINSLLSGCNTLAVFGTGRGKSAIFQTVAAYLAIKAQKMTVIVYPLRALVNDQYESLLRKMAPLGLRVFKGNGALSSKERGELFSALEAGTVDLLLTTPEFLGCHMEKVISGDIGFFVVDESHHIADAHRPAYKRLGLLKERLGNPLTLAVTATANNVVADEIVDTLSIENVIIDRYVRENLEILDQRNLFDKAGYLKQIVAGGAKTIIYVNSRMQTVELAMLLREAIPGMRDKVIFYHAGLTSEQRATVEVMFRKGEVTTIVSTSAFGEGIDVSDTRHVVIYHMNFSFTDFNQQCGRCGRDGQRAQIHLLCGERDARINEFILDMACPDRNVLAGLYSVLAKMGEKEIRIGNEELSQMVAKMINKKVGAETVSAGLGILEELGLILREGYTHARTIVMCDVPEIKLDLNQSTGYIEGLELKKAFQDFHDFFTSAKSTEIRDFIQIPIYPEKYLKENLEPAS